MPARPRPARRSSSKPSPSPGFSDGGPNRTTSGRGRPQVRRSAGASPPLRAQAPRAKNLEDRLESRNPVLGRRLGLVPWLAVEQTTRVESPEIRYARSGDVHIAY